MLNKKEFCIQYLENYAKAHGWDSWDLLPETECLRSSCVAVAMQHMGLIHDKELKVYANGRDGILFSYSNPKEKTFKGLSFREMLKLLPAD